MNQYSIFLKHPETKRMAAAILFDLFSIRAGSQDFHHIFHVFCYISVENCGSGHNDIGTGIQNDLHIVPGDTAVYFDIHMSLAGINKLPGLPDSSRGSRDILLSAETGFDAHHQHQIHLRPRLLQQRRDRVPPS